MPARLLSLAITGARGNMGTAVPGRERGAETRVTGITIGEFGLYDAFAEAEP